MTVDPLVAVPMIFGVVLLPGEVGVVEVSVGGAGSTVRVSCCAELVVFVS